MCWISECSTSAFLPCMILLAYCKVFFGENVMLQWSVNAVDMYRNCCCILPPIDLLLEKFLLIEEGSSHLFILSSVFSFSVRIARDVLMCTSFCTFLVLRY